MTITARFASSCSRCHNTINAGELINWIKGGAASHATIGQCVAATEAVLARGPVTAAPIQTAVVNLSAVATFIGAARDRGLKFPKARFLAPGGGELRLSVAGSGARVPGAIQVKLDDEWIGRVNPDGAVVGQTLNGRADILAALAAIGADPVAAAKAYGALMCRCSFCDKSLTDEGSVEVGYGPVCAKKFGLPHAPKGTRDLHVEAA